MMETTKNRWKRAQSAEAVNKSHSQRFRSKEYSKRFLSSLNLSPEFIRDKRILQVGSGTGFIHSLESPSLSIGIDPLTREFTPVLEGSNARIMTGIGENLPFAAKTFDIVLCINVLDHTFQPASVLGEIRRVLVDNGILIFDVNVFSAPKILLRIADKLDRPHPHHFTHSSARGLLEITGFEIEREILVRRKPRFGDSAKRWISDTVFRRRTYRLYARIQ